jgi:hypothetical protein
MPHHECITALKNGSDCFPDKRSRPELCPDRLQSYSQRPVDSLASDTLALTLSYVQRT